MKKIYCSPVIPMGSNTEYYLGQKELCKDGEKWNGNIYQYLFDKWDYDEACGNVNGEYNGIICDLPKHSVVMSLARIPRCVYWVEEE